ncbi:hypothetical protein TSTA_110780 [Talaromyces stipitatus ATCC 10500]|uniref:Uncharacterized protein n=1 Tax=Talaromyces stipitatus (strain ATCC 10500 / CBS 375.48 / QM 6759 / NRRL 1006) TaxID=441959 RepID=B8MV09_TALSN|nr:uncharacterized protein TSTA_110780 [Talaromyces stipitatus ATCC 10500]EED11899.1 hypothetical protein TSTA_110780 [Talaromyces stipitatus ATCC 10500]
MEEAYIVCDHFKEGEQLSIRSQEALARIRILALWIYRSPQQTPRVPIYYELHDLLDEASERKERFLDLDEDISLAVKEGMKKYKKYYTFMNASDTYYTAIVLDPRIKGDLFLDELEDETTRKEILQALCDNLHCDYPVPNIESSSPTGWCLLDRTTEHNDVESRLLNRSQPRNQPLLSDIDLYLNNPLLFQPLRAQSRVTLSGRIEKSYQHQMSELDRGRRLAQRFMIAYSNQADWQRHG